MTEKTKYFKPAEFKCRCNRPECDAPAVSEFLVQKLDLLREHWGKPLRVTSGVRCKHWNEKVGGAPKSQHVLGLAADLAVGNRKEALELMKLARKLGFIGIGVAEKFVHVDMRSGIARSWEYPAR